eukprot:c36200_g1_i1 orf=211-405(+)
MCAHLVWLVFSVTFLQVDILARVLRTGAQGGVGLPHSTPGSWRAKGDEEKKRRKEEIAAETLLV